MIIFTSIMIYSQFSHFMTAADVISGSKRILQFVIMGKLSEKHTHVKRGLAAKS